jgi:hypothetical protein
MTNAIPPAKAEQKDAIARLPHSQNCGVAVDDVHRYPEACRLANEIVEPAIGALSAEDTALRLRAQAWIVECQLFTWINV